MVAKGEACITGTMYPELIFGERVPNTRNTQDSFQVHVALTRLVFPVRIFPQTAQGSTALMLACKRGHEEVVRVLLTAGAELHQKDSRGRTARDTASKRHHESILAMLHPAKQMRLMQVREGM